MTNLFLSATKKGFPFCLAFISIESIVSRTHAHRHRHTFIFGYMCCRFLLLLNFVVVKHRMFDIAMVISLGMGMAFSVHSLIYREDVRLLGIFKMCVEYVIHANDFACWRLQSRHRLNGVEYSTIFLFILRCYAFWRVIRTHKITIFWNNRWQTTCIRSTMHGCSNELRTKWWNASK